MKKANTRRALALSFLSLLLCASMLIGTTFAWFTDSASMAVNTIQSGTLDVDLQDKDGNSIVGQSLDFIKADGAPAGEAILWEPGCTYTLPAFKVVNLGNLALKYKVEITGITGDAKLLEAIEFTYTTASGAAWDHAAEGQLPADAETELITITGHMKEEAGNEYQGLTVDGIGITVFATQLAYEYDSEDNQYDDMALVNNEADLRDAFAAGRNVMLAGDVSVNADTTITVPADAEILLDLNGHKIESVSATSGKNRSTFTVKGKMDVVGEGAVSVSYTGANMGWNNLVAAFSVEAGELTLGEGVRIANLGGTDMAYAVDVNTTLGEAVLNVNGANLYSSYIGVRIFNNHATEKGIVNYNSGVIQGAKNGYDIWAQLMSRPAENAVVNIAAGINYTTADLSGTMYYIESDTTMAANVTELSNAIAAGGEVVLAGDLVVNQQITLPAGKETVLDLGGNTLSGAFSNSGSSALINNQGSLTVTNGTLISLAEYPDVDWGTEGFPTYATNTISNRGTLVVGPGAVIENETAVGGASYAIDNYSGGSLVINGGTIKAKDVAIRMFVTSATVENNVTINGGTISGKRSVWLHVAGSNAAAAPLATLEINGGEFFTTSGLAIYSYSYGNSFANVNVLLNGGVFHGDVQFGGGYKGDTENVTITGGVFEGDLGRWATSSQFVDIPKP